MQNITSTLLAKRNVTTAKNGIEESNKYDVINVVFNDDIKTDLLDKLDIAYKIKDDVFGDDYSVDDFVQITQQIIDKALVALDKLKQLKLPELNTQIETDLGLIVKDAQYLIPDSTIKTLTQPEVFTDGETLYLTLDKTQQKPIKALNTAGVTSVNAMPSKFTDIVHGISNVDVTLEDLNAMEDNPTNVPSVAYNGVFTSIIPFLAISNQVQKGIVKFATPQEIADKIHSASAVTPLDIINLIKKTTFVQEIKGGQPNTTYAYKNGKWIKYTNPKTQVPANDQIPGITKLATLNELNTGANVFHAVTVADMEDYLAVNLPQLNKLPPADGRFYAAVNPNEHKLKYGYTANWVEIYNDPTSVPLATYNVFGTGYLADSNDLTTKPDSQPRILTGKSLDDYLKAIYQNFKTRSPTTGEFVLKVSLNAGAITREFEPFKNMLTNATSTVYGTTILNAGTNKTATNEALTPAGFNHLLTTTFSAGIVKFPPITNPTKNVYARTAGGYKKIAGTLPLATTTTFGGVKVALVSNTMAKLTTLIQDRTKGQMVLPTGDINTIENEIKTYFAGMPNDGNTYLFKKKNTANALDYTQVNLNNLSKFKSVFLDENNLTIKTSYQTAVHVVNNTDEMQSIPANRKDYAVNIAQLVGV